MTAIPVPDALQARVALELATRSPPGAELLVDAVRQRFAGQVSAILFYGSCRRTGDMTGLLDLYVLHDGYRRFYRRRLPAISNRLLPPNVMQLTVPDRSGGSLRAKVAIISRRQFARRMRPASLDTTIWTRFCQPASLLHVSDPDVRRWVEGTIAAGIRTAVFWAGRLEPEADPASRWRTLFAHTYRLELRPEASHRADGIYGSEAAWFDEVMALAQAAPTQSAPTPAARRPAWFWRRLLGKPLNILRLVKAAFTFEGGADYLSAKLGRHTGVFPVPGPWQRRHPLLAAPALLWAHRRALRKHRKRASVTGS